MKLKCINKHEADGSLTLNKTYHFIPKDTDYIIIYNDFNKWEAYKVNDFIPINTAVNKREIIRRLDAEIDILEDQFNLMHKADDLIQNEIRIDTIEKIRDLIEEI